MLEVATSWHSSAHMEFAPYTLGDGIMPEHSSFDKLGDYSAMKVAQGDLTIFMTYCRGTAFKFNKVDDPSVDGFAVYNAATTKAASHFGSKYIIIRPIASKLLLITGNGDKGQCKLVLDKGSNTLNLKIVGSMTGETVCQMNPKINVTVAELKAMVVQELVANDAMSKSTQLIFTNDEMINVNSNRQIRNVFKVITVTDAKDVFGGAVRLVANADVTVKSKTSKKIAANKKNVINAMLKHA